jgi:dCMP deaminase
MNQVTRPDWEEYAIGLAKAASKRADCIRRQVGAVILSPDHLVIGTGYNGTRAGAVGCLAGGCPRGLLSYDEVKEFSDYNAVGTPGYCISTHAEPNAMLHASGPLEGCLMAITDQPCEGCRKLIYNAGLIRVIWPTGSYTFS